MSIDVDPLRHAMAGWYGLVDRFSVGVGARMAVVTAVYDAATAVRGPAVIMPADATERSTRRPGPKAVNREVDASIVDSTAPMTRRLFDRAQQRDPQHLRRWIVLVDGNNHQIDRIYLTAKQPYLIYQIALTMGWPIATGVIEGTCRYLAKDRLAITGAAGACPALKPSSYSAP